MSYQPGATYTEGRVDYADRSALERELVPFLSNGIIPVRGTALPLSAEEIAFELGLPGGTKLPLKGRVISHKGDGGLIQISDFDAGILELVREDLNGSEKPIAPGPAPDRRIFSRQQLNLDVRIGTALGKTTDLSPRGMGVEISPILVPGTTVTGTLTPADGPAISFTATARWARVPSVVGGPGRMGLRIESISDSYYQLFQPRTEKQAASCPATSTPAATQEAGAASPAPARPSAANAADAASASAQAPSKVASAKGAPASARREAALVVSGEATASGAIQAAGRGKFWMTTAPSAAAAIGELHGRAFDWLFLDEDLNLSSIVLAAFTYLEVAPKLVFLRSPKNRDKPSPARRLLMKPFVANDVIERIFVPDLDLKDPNSKLGKDWEDRLKKGEQHFRAAEQDLKEGKVESALKNVALAISFAPFKDEFYELRRVLLARVGAMRAQVAFKRGDLLEAEGKPTEAIASYDLAYEADPLARYVKAAAKARLRAKVELPKARTLALVATRLDKYDEDAKALVETISKALSSK